MRRLAWVFVVVFALCTVNEIFGVSLVGNGDFESEADAWASGWGRGQHLSWQTEDGNRFMRIESQEPGKMFTLYRVIELPKDAKALSLSFRARVSNLKRGEKNWYDARLIMNFKDASGKQISGAPHPNFGKDTEGWVERKVEFLVPENAVRLEFLPSLFNVRSGTFDIDDISLVVVPAEPILEKIKKEAELKAMDAQKRAELVKPQIPPTPADKLPPALKVSGNKIIDSSGTEVWLQGVCVDSMQWAANGENILKSVHEALVNWKANCIRLPVREDFWEGTGPWQNDTGAGYRQLVDDVVNLCGAHGAYVVIDLHRFRAPEQKHADFWKSVAAKYKNHPVVLFELFNEPHDISWEVWRDGGAVRDEKRSEDVVAENNEKLRGFHSVGMQKLVDTVREEGAKNIVVVGGLDWSYDLSGILNGFALDDRGGNGIVYSSHVYPWKRGWQKHFVDAAEKHPIFLGELGNLRSWDDFKFIGPAQRYEPVGPESAWPHDMLGLIQKHRLHWTGFSFHPSCGPQILLDWDYNPTPFWGVFVKDALAGKQFELKNMR